MKNVTAAPSPPTTLPRLDELAALYKKAKSAKDDRMLTVAETSVLRVALAESAAAEANVLAAFARGGT